MSVVSLLLASLARLALMSQNCSRGSTLQYPVLYAPTDCSFALPRTVHGTPAPSRIKYVTNKIFLARMSRAPARLPQRRSGSEARVVLGPERRETRVERDDARPGEVCLYSKYLHENDEDGRGD